jgi:hypothetical protein
MHGEKLGKDVEEELLKCLVCLESSTGNIASLKKKITVRVTNSNLHSQN